MVTLAPAHPVYAAQEDAYQRDRQAEDTAEYLFESACPLVHKIIAQWQKEGVAAERPIFPLGEEITDALKQAFWLGWEAARDQQRNG